MKKVILFAAALMLCLSAAAQTIGKNELAEIQGSFLKDPSTVALQNVLSHNTDINTYVKTSMAQFIAGEKELNETTCADFISTLDSTYRYSEFVNYANDFWHAMAG